MATRSTVELKATGNPRALGASLGYVPALDGLRALAVLAVILYHAHLPPWLPGGFLGVEVFFVISGYLITSLLLKEWERDQRVNLKVFWLRRARRLLPALFLLLAVVLTFAVLFLPEEVAGLRPAALAAATYVSNWLLIFQNLSYFQTVGRPPLLQHLWSLAVEEQFYLIWPPLFFLLMRLLRRRTVMLVAGAAALASTALMIALYQPDTDPSRIYYGTDTRAAGLLIGVVLAFIWAPGRRSRVPAVLLDGAGLLALAGLCFAFYRLNEFEPFLYLGGFSVVSLASALLIATAVDGRARLLPRMLGWGLLRWVGLRSYGIYLWHWPVFQVTRPQLDLPLDGLPLFALRLALTLVLVELSYRFVEMPVRTGALGRAWHGVRAASGVRRWRLAGSWTAVAVLVLAYCGLLINNVAAAKTPPPPAYLSVEAVDSVPSSGPPVPATGAAALPGSTVESGGPALPSAPAAEQSVRQNADPVLGQDSAQAARQAPRIQPHPPAGAVPRTGGGALHAPGAGEVSPSASTPAATVRSPGFMPVPGGIAWETPAALATAPTAAAATPDAAAVMNSARDLLGQTTQAARATAANSSRASTPAPDFWQWFGGWWGALAAAPALTSATSTPLPAASPTPFPAATTTPLPATSTPVVRPTSQPQPPSDAVAAQATPIPATPRPVAPTPTPVGCGDCVLAIGDSVMVGAAPELAAAIPYVHVDAAVSRQVATAIQILQVRKAAGQLGNVVIVHLGTNGTFSARQFDEMMQVLQEQRRVVFVNVKVPRVWEAANDQVLAEGVKRYPSAVLVNWHSAGGAHPEWFWDDGIHLRPAGAKAYAAMIAAAISAP